jgi:hypothetical protein
MTSTSFAQLSQKLSVFLLEFSMWVRRWQYPAYRLEWSLGQMDCFEPLLGQDLTS